MRRPGEKALGFSLLLSGAFGFLALTCGNYGPTLPAPGEPPQLGPPVATTVTASGVAQTTAIINGDITCRGPRVCHGTTFYFEYGATASYGSQTTAQTAPSGFTTLNATFSLTGLQPGTTYHYRLVATNTAGASQGADMIFTTAAPALTYAVTLTGVNATGDTSGQSAQVSGLPVSGPEVPVQ